MKNNLYWIYLEVVSGVLFIIIDKHSQSALVFKSHQKTLWEAESYGICRRNILAPFGIIIGD